MKSYDWLLLDADNTLFDFDRCEGQALQLALAEHGVPFADDHHPTYNVINRQCWRDYEEKKITKEELRLRRFELFFNSIGVSLDPDQFGRNYLVHLSTAAFLLDGALETLGKLQANHQLALVTNGLKEVQRPRLEAGALNGFFDVIIVSDEIGYAKPHAPFFEYTFEQIGRPEKERVMIVGDNINADIKGGLDYGIDACWFNPGQQDKPHDIQPTYEIQNLSQLLSLL
ncbi:YjjG family noncanonical pyrimidine nucleotidase [Flavilitoribacter nigricans]|uniref:Noncanonical pyrimidine nucleotidase, YjjG family n=1 Tax=Flavilitoribacter nigricans (strain ATCC 23147 / DSM 23189 / NBRC 102662 / NCIMB 1420 / SS-2) TaxID=1122177 RepID=A0A2D0NIQ1_FLAN2|nr:YjjG family noncanonical pyrimidine nucleotidase [Flavilitoribacter nigricans]PHN07633.1 noncanonical pyrimidine nucleotidase, YjjG family [Flavilitoribacter nigricans DSM 23189 = NBRC 102662]